nr:uncharacterized protein LOC112770228 [Arachis hypogaea]
MGHHVATFILIVLSYIVRSSLQHFYRTAAAVRAVGIVCGQALSCSSASSFPLSSVRPPWLLYFVGLEQLAVSSLAVVSPIAVRVSVEAMKFCSHWIRKSTKWRVENIIMCSTVFYISCLFCIYTGGWLGADISDAC